MAIFFARFVLHENDEINNTMILYFADGSWIVWDSYYDRGQFVYGSMDEDGIADMSRKVMENSFVNDSILHTDY